MKNIPIMEGYPDFIRVRMQNRALKRKNEFPDLVNGKAIELVLEDLLLWDIPSLKISFKGGDELLHKKIAETAAAWSKYAHIEFDFGYNPSTKKYREWVAGDVSHLRIGFQEMGYWSFVGTDSQDPNICKPGEITLNLEKFNIRLPGDWKTTVLHEFGHALGFHHEHQSPVSKCDFDWETLYRYLAGPPNYWSKEKVDFNLRQMPAGGLTYSPHDKHSIMHYSFPEWMFLSGKYSPCFIFGNKDLSAEDKRMAGLAYPFEKEKTAQLMLLKKQFQKVLLEHQLLAIPQLKNVITIEEQVKKNILIAAGQAGEDPQNLDKEMELGNLLPTSAAYQFLADLLDELIKGYKKGAKVKVGEVVSCATVGICIDLVISKI